ncbi:MAG: hypothetical protein IIC51_02555 [Planctomycetes bacterium]|nr:hypothetical protein [Planctomycetota bacterium]
MRQYALAEENFEVAVRYTPKNAPYNHFLGLTEYLLGKHEEASVHLLAALSLRPDLEDYYYMGRIYMAQQREEMNKVGKITRLD